MPPASAPVVLLTGSSSGIGLALARKLWQQDYRVVITARSESLAKLTSEPFHETERFLIKPLDVRSYASQQELVDSIIQLWGSVDILINNAGISYRAVVEDMDVESEINQLSTNYLGPMNLTRLLLPIMRESGRGRIINVSSVGGMMAMPTMGSYSASKFALEGATEALWYEMRPWNIFVTLIEPGFINSNSFTHVYSTHKSRSLDESPYEPYYRHMSAFIARLMRRAVATPEKIADIILAVMRQSNPPLRVQATFDAWVFSMLRRVLPRRPYHYLLYRSLPGLKEWGKFDD